MELTVELGLHFTLKTNKLNMSTAIFLPSVVLRLVLLPGTFTQRGKTHCLDPPNSTRTKKNT